MLHDATPLIQQQFKGAAGKPGKESQLLIKEQTQIKRKVQLATQFRGVFLAAGVQLEQGYQYCPHSEPSSSC